DRVPRQRLQQLHDRRDRQRQQPASLTSSYHWTRGGTSGASWSSTRNEVRAPRTCTVALVALSASMRSITKPAPCTSTRRDAAARRRSAESSRRTLSLNSVSASASSHASNSTTSRRAAPASASDAGNGRRCTAPCCASTSRTPNVASVIGAYV